jgi:peptide chain release factor subunit 1
VSVPPERNISDVSAYLRNEASQASNIKSTGTRKNVTGAIESLLSRLRYYKQPPANGLVLFVGAVVTGNNQQEMKAFVFEPPEPVKSFLYRCDSTFFTEPLEEFLVERDIYGLLLIDRRECCAGILRGKRISQVFYDTSTVPGKHGRGGQSQRRFERLTEIAADEWFKSSGERVSEIFRNTPGLKGILIGGPGPSKKYFYDGNFLHYELQPKVIDLFDTGYTDEYGLKELVERAEGALQNLGITKEKQLMRAFMKEVQGLEAGLATYGEDQVRYSLQMGAVKTLMLSEGLRRYRATVACTNCDYVAGARTIPAARVEDKLDEKCPQCQSRLALKDPKDLVDELSELAEATGAQVELVSQDSEDGETLLKAFGGIAGLLRYRVEAPRATG